MLEIAHEHPDKTLSTMRHLRMPAHHEVRSANVDLKRLGAVLAVAYERDLHDFAEFRCVCYRRPIAAAYDAVAGAVFGFTLGITTANLLAPAPFWAFVS